MTDFRMSIRHHRKQELQWWAFCAVVKNRPPPSLACPFPILEYLGLIPSSTSDSNFLLMHRLTENRWELKNFGPYYMHGRLRLSSGLLALIWPALYVATFRSSELVCGRKIYASLCLSNKRKIYIFKLVHILIFSDASLIVPFPLSQSIPSLFSILTPTLTATAYSFQFFCPSNLVLCPFF